MKDYDSIKLKNQICFPLYLCSKEVIRRYTPYLDKLDLTYTQYIVMMYMWEKKESNVKEIGDVLLLDSSTLTPLLKKLEKKEYIKRARKEEDERNLLITLTKKGDALKEKALPIKDEVSKKIKISNEESEKLQKILCKILLNLNKEE